MKLKKIQNKKSQEEMVGFILIIVLVIVGILFILFIVLRQPSQGLESREIESFLHASMLYTTDCQRDVSSYYDLKGLIQECNNNENCYNETRNTCDVLNETFSNLIESAFTIGEDSPYKGYILNVLGTETLLELEKGNSNVDSFGYSITIPPSRGFGDDIIVDFRLFRLI
jgi:hypothetical protein